MKWFARPLLSFMIVVSGAAFAQSDDWIQSWGQIEASPYGGVTIMDWSCGDWTGWFTSSNYCGPAHLQCWCEWAGFEFSGRYEDQYRTRECTNPVTGDSITDYDFRTIRVGCCRGRDCPP